MEEYKEQTQQAYDTFTDKFEKKFQRFFDKHAHKRLDRLAKRIRPQSRILDIGSGPGIHAARFQEHGHRVLCVDNSSEMARRCKEKGLQTVVMDVEQLGFNGMKFDGIYANTSLLHMPKSNLRRTIKNLAGLVMHEGWMRVTMKEGDSEGMMSKDHNPETSRWFSLYQDGELRGYFQPWFAVEEFKRRNVEGTVFLSYVLQKVA